MVAIAGSSVGDLGELLRDKRMHPAVFRVFEDVCSRAEIEGAVLEVGAVAGPDSLLMMPCLRRLPSRIGLNLDGAMAGECAGYPIVVGNANAMTAFADGSFSAVLCNATLEHDRYFWKTLAEIQRVTAPGGLIAIGVPGYAGMGLAGSAPGGSWFGRLFGLLARGAHLDWIRASTVTLGVHNFPGDYYRFSEQAVRDVFMEGLVDVSIRLVMSPPRIIGWGRKPCVTATPT
jgi:SAM-dependent methyltransferase